MAHTLGGVSFGTGENPFDGEINYVRQTRWADARPLGYTGIISTAVGVEPLTHRLRCWLDSTTYQAIKALSDAAASAGTTHAWVYTDGDIGIASQTVLIKAFVARKNRAVKGAARWDCELVLQEVV